MDGMEDARDVKREEGRSIPHCFYCFQFAVCDRTAISDFLYSMRQTTFKPPAHLTHAWDV